MVLSQFVVALLVLVEVIGLPGNLVVIVTVALESRFHVMRYILLASLAVSDFLSLILVNSFRVASIANKRWLYGETMCYLNPCLLRYFYFNTVFHLLAVSYERYQAIVQSPLTHDGTINKSRVAIIALAWVMPIPFSITPFLGWGKFVYNPQVFYCEQGFVQSASSRGNAVIFAMLFFFAPFLVITLLNWSVYRVTRRQTLAVSVQIGNFDGAEDNSHKNVTRRESDRKAAKDVIIIIAAFLLCFLPTWISGIFRSFVQEASVPAEVTLITSSIFFVNSLCNPIIYSNRKREFRKAVYTLLTRTGVCGNANVIPNIQRNVIEMTTSNTLNREGPTESSAAVLAT